MKRKRRMNGEGSLIKIKNCRFWYAQYYDASGKQVRVSTRTEDQKKALTKLRDLMSERDKGFTSPADLRNVTYGTLRAGLLASYEARGNKSLLMSADGTEFIPGLKPLDKFFGFENGKPGLQASKITTDTGRRFAEQRKAELDALDKRRGKTREDDAHNAAINRSLAALRRMLRLAHRDGKITRVPFIELRQEPDARDGAVTPEEFERLMVVLPSRLRPLVCLLYSTGVRLGEAQQIEWSQVDFNAGKRGLIFLEGRQTKNKNPRVLPITERLLPMLKEMEPKEGRVFDAANIRKEWMKACAAAGLGNIIPVDGKKYDPRYEGVTIHDLRRSAITNMVRSGIRETVAMRISGHKTASVFRRYNIVSPADIDEAMDKTESENEKQNVKMVKKSLVALSSRG